jgi:hypothetical protein
MPEQDLEERKKGRNDHVVATRHSCALRLISRPTSEISFAGMILSIKLVIISGSECDHPGSIPCEYL